MCNVTETMKIRYETTKLHISRIWQIIGRATRSLLGILVINYSKNNSNSKIIQKE